MSMDAAPQSHTAADEAPQESRPPRIPIERHVVRSVLALEQIKANADQTLLVMSHFNFDAPDIPAYIGAMRQGLDELTSAYMTYLELIHCEGQA